MKKKLKEVGEMKSDPPAQSSSTPEIETTVRKGDNPDEVIISNSMITYTVKCSSMIPCKDLKEKPKDGCCPDGYRKKDPGDPRNVLCDRLPDEIELDNKIGELCGFS